MNLIYNHNFQEKFDFFIMQDGEIKTILRASKGELQEKMKDTTAGKAYSNPTYPTLTH